MLSSCSQMPLVTSIMHVSVIPTPPRAAPLLLLAGLGRKLELPAGKHWPVGHGFPSEVMLASGGTHVPPSSHTGCSYRWPTWHVQGQKTAQGLSSSACHHSLALHLQQRRFFRSGYCYLLVLAPHSSKGSPTASGFVQSETRGHSTNNLRSRQGGDWEQCRYALEKRPGPGCDFGDAQPWAGATFQPLPSRAPAHGHPDRTVVSWQRGEPWLEVRGEQACKSQSCSAKLVNISRGSQSLKLHKLGKAWPAALLKSYKVSGFNT